MQSDGKFYLQFLQSDYISFPYTVLWYLILQFDSFITYLMPLIIRVIRMIGVPKCAPPWIALYTRVPLCRIGAARERCSLALRRRRNIELVIPYVDQHVDSSNATLKTWGKFSLLVLVLLQGTLLRSSVAIVSSECH